MKEASPDLSRIISELLHLRATFSLSVAGNYSEKFYYMIASLLISVKLLGNLVILICQYKYSRCGIVKRNKCVEPNFVDQLLNSSNCHNSYLNNVEIKSP